MKLIFVIFFASIAAIGFLSFFHHNSIPITGLSAAVSQVNKDSAVQVPTPSPSMASQLVHHLFNIENMSSTKAVAFSPDGKELWATLLLNTKRGVSVFDTATGKKIADIALGDGGGVELLFSKDGSKVYVSQMETAKVFEIDVASKKVVRSLSTKSSWTKVLALSPDGKRLYASNWVGNDVSEINLDSGLLVRKIPTVRAPRGLYASNSGKYLYVAGFENGDIQKIDLSTGKGKIIFSTGGAMRHFVADESRGVLFVSDMGTDAIWRISLTSDSVEKFATTDHNPNTIALSPDKKILIVSCRGKNFSADNYYKPGPEWGTVLLYNAENGNMLDAIVGGNQPTALDISPSGERLAFSDFLDARIQMYEIPSHEVLFHGNGGYSGVYKSKIQKK